MQLEPPKVVNLAQLLGELSAAGVQVEAIGSLGDPPTEVHTYAADGSMQDLPAAAAPVVAAHVAAVPQVQPAPDVPKLIGALASSPSIDQPTKDALVAALKGQ